MGVVFVAMSNPPTKGSYSVSDLLSKAEELLQSANTVPLAQKFYERALEQEPNNTEIMDDYAECLLELQEIEQAGQLISKSIELDPEGGYQKYMIAGQLTSGMDSLSCFNKGIEILLRMHEEAKKSTRRGGSPIGTGTSSLLGLLFDGRNFYDRLLFRGGRRGRVHSLDRRGH